MDQIDEKFNFLMELIENDTWEPVSNLDNVRIQRKFLPGCAIACFMADGFVNANPDELMNFVWSIYENVESMKKYDPDISNYHIFSLPNTDARLCYQINTLPWPLWHRDLVYLQSIKVTNNGKWFLMYSVESTDIPKKDEQYVRAVINISAYGFVPEGNGCHVYRIAHVDPAGSIPSSIINNYADKTSKMIKELRVIYSEN